MKNLTLPPVLLFICLSPIVLAGCSSKPLDELKLARTAMDQARSNEASVYAPVDWDKARMDWEEANALVQMGRYSEARNLLALSAANFNTAREVAARRLESLKVEIGALGNNTKTELKKLEEVLQNPKATPLLKREIDRSIPFIEERITVMNTALGQKEYLRARTAGQEASGRIHELEEKLANSR